MARTAHLLAVLATLSVASGFSTVHSRAGLRPIALQRRVAPTALRMAVPEPAATADEGLVAPAPSRRSRASKATKVAFGLAAAFAVSADPILFRSVPSPVARAACSRHLVSSRLEREAWPSELAPPSPLTLHHHRQTSLPAVAAKAAESTEHLHIGQKVAQVFQGRGL